jgi:hypothetical protein
MRLRAAAFAVSPVGLPVVGEPDAAATVAGIVVAAPLVMLGDRETRRRALRRGRIVPAEHVVASGPGEDVR